LRRAIIFSILARTSERLQKRNDMTYEKGGRGHVTLKSVGKLVTV